MPIGIPIREKRLRKREQGHPAKTERGKHIARSGPSAEMNPVQRRAAKERLGKGIVGHNSNPTMYALENPLKFEGKGQKRSGSKRRKDRRKR